MNHMCNVLLLKKTQRALKPEESFFLKNCGINYEGQSTNPLMFYSIALKKNINIILFDPRGFDNLCEVIEVLSSLQRFTNCYIILCRDIPEEYKMNLNLVISDKTITDPMLKISDCLLKIKKLQNANPDVETQLLFDKIQNILFHLGFDASIKGFNYLCDCIHYIYVKKTPSINLVSDVYRYVAQQNNTRDYRVERDIRHAIDKAMLNCDHKKLLEHNKLCSFNNIMFETSAKPLILAVVNFLKYNTTFV